MSSACTPKCDVSVSRLQTLAGELRQLQAGMADMQARLEHMLNELAAELHHDGAGVEAVTPTAAGAAMQQATSPTQDADVGADEKLPINAGQIPAAAAITVPVATTEPAAKLPVVYADQLQWIAAIDEAAVAMLRSRGITTFAGIAAMTARDVREIGEQMGDTQMIAKQGWIEQAALLAHGIDRAYASKVTGTHSSAGESAVHGSQALEKMAAEPQPICEALAMAVEAVSQLLGAPPAGAETVPSAAAPATPLAAPQPAALSHNVIDLATRRRPTTLNTRPFAARAARWAATIFLTVMAAALTATQVGLASDSITPHFALPDADSLCTDMSPLCAILPGIPW